MLYFLFTRLWAVLATHTISNCLPLHSYRFILIESTMILLPRDSLEVRKNSHSLTFRRHLLAWVISTACQLCNGRGLPQTPFYRQCLMDNVHCYITFKVRKLISKMNHPSNRKTLPFLLPWLGADRGGSGMKHHHNIFRHSRSALNGIWRQTVQSYVLSECLKGVFNN